jgi:hypothetical protein
MFPVLMSPSASFRRFSFGKDDEAAVTHGHGKTAFRAEGDTGGFAGSLDKPQDGPIPTDDADARTGAAPEASL